MPRGIRCVWCDLAGRSSSGMDGTTGVSGGAHRSLSPLSKGRGKNTFYESMVVSTCRRAPTVLRWPRRRALSYVIGVANGSGWVGSVFIGLSHKSNSTRLGSMRVMRII